MTPIEHNPRRDTTHDAPTKDRAMTVNLPRHISTHLLTRCPIPVCVDADLSERSFHVPDRYAPRVHEAAFELADALMTENDRATAALVARAIFAAAYDA